MFIVQCDQDEYPDEELVNELVKYGETLGSMLTASV